MRQWELLHFLVHVSPQKALQNSRRQTSISEWKKFHRYKELSRIWVKGSTDVWLTNLVWEIPEEWIHVKTPTLSFSFKICQWVFQTMNKKKMKDQKRSHLLWIWDIVLLSKERNSDKNLKNNKKKISEKKKKRFLVWQDSSCTPGCNVWVRAIYWCRQLVQGWKWQVW